MSRPAVSGLATKGHRRIFLHLALSVMTASWVSGLLWALLGDAGPPMPVILVVLTGLILLPIQFDRLLRGLELRKDVRRGVLTVAFILYAALIVSSGFYNAYGLFGTGWLSRLVRDDLSSPTFLNQTTSLVVATLCWWLGLTLGNLPLTSDNLTRYFYGVLAAWAAFSIPSSFFLYDIYPDALGLFFVYLFAGLVVLGLGRVEEVSRRAQERGAGVSAYWLMALGVMAGMIVGLVGIAYALRLGNGFGLILIVIAPVLAALAYPLVFIGAKVIALALSLLLEGPTPRVVNEPDLAAGGPQISEVFEPNSLQSLCVGLVVLGVVLLIVLGTLFSLRRWRKMARDVTREEEATLPSLGQQISEAVDERLARAGFRVPGLGRLRRRLAARSIRRIYAALCALAAERGYPRPGARTPYEHLAALHLAFPACDAQVLQITRAYVAAHYGQVPDSRQGLAEIQSSWEQVRTMARRTLPVPDEREGQVSQNVRE